MSQLALFVEAPPSAAIVRAPERRIAHAPIADPYHPTLSDLALLYTATERGSNSGIRFMMSLSDAQAWCDSKESRGRHYDTEWAYFYSTVRNFIACHWGPKAPTIDVSKVVDSGEWDARIASAGLRKINVAEFRDVLTPLGVTVMDKKGTWYPQGARAAS